MSLVKNGMFLVGFGQDCGELFLCKDDYGNDVLPIFAKEATGIAFIDTICKDHPRHEELFMRNYCLYYGLERIVGENRRGIMFFAIEPENLTATEKAVPLERLLKYFLILAFYEGQAVQRFAHMEVPYYSDSADNGEELILAWRKEMMYWDSPHENNYEQRKED